MQINLPAVRKGPAGSMQRMHDTVVDWTTQNIADMSINMAVIFPSLHAAVVVGSYYFSGDFRIPCLIL